MTKRCCRRGGHGGEIAALADPLLAQSAIDRLQSAVWELIIEGEAYRRRQKPTLNPSDKTPKEARRRQPSC